MELTLFGSQINLATRNKPETPTIFYPPQHRRPISATSTTTPTTYRCSSSSSSTNNNKGQIQQNNHFAHQHHHQHPHHHPQHHQHTSNHHQNNDFYNSMKKRPLSADDNNSSKLYSHNLITTKLNRSTGDLIGKKLNNKKIKSYSSKNIYKLLLTEPIKRSWTPQSGDSANSDNSNLIYQPRSRKSKLNCRVDMNNDELSSAEEEVEEVDEFGTNEGENDIDDRNENSKFSSFKLNKSNFESSNNYESSKKYVTFSKNTTIVPDSNRSQQLTADSYTNSNTTTEKNDPTIATAIDKQDLPGRVSFSKDFVYEIDYTDYDQYSWSENMNNQNAITSFPATAATAAEAAETVTSDNNIQSAGKKKCSSYCCSEKCNNYDLIDAESVVEKNSITTATTKTTHQSATIIPYDPKSYQDNDDEIIEEINKELNNESDKKLINNENSTPKFDNSKLTPSISNDEIIKNYLKVTTNKLKLKEQFSRPGDNDNLTLTKFSKETTSPKPKPTRLSTSSSSSNPIRNGITNGGSNNETPEKSMKTKKSYKDDNKLNAFEIDKVESWMSLNDFEESIVSPTKLITQPTSNSLTNGNKIANGGGGGGNLTSSNNLKTDDEGNFSYEESTTYDEIFSVIKEIDDEKHQDLDLQISNPSTKNIDDITTGNSMIDMNNSEKSSTDKMRLIFSYLDEVNSNSTKIMHETHSNKLQHSYRSEYEFPIEPMDIVGEMPKLADLITLPNHQLARRIIALSLRANELSNAIQLSKEHMSSVRTNKIKSIRAEKQNAQYRLSEQKKHFESIIIRHQGFIEQLLKDKAVLCDKVSALTRRIESQNQAWEHKLETEMVRVKETTLAGEKIRRERWIRENTKKIKELTVKGLEQEINRMTCNHQKEITELKCQNQRDLLNAVEEARQKHELLELNIRDLYAQDRETAIEKERNAIRERFERQIEAEQKSVEELKQRFRIEAQMEKERLLTEIKDKERQYDQRLEMFEHDKNSMLSHMKNEFKGRISIIENKNQADLQSIREQYEADFTIWKREHEAMYKLREVEKENTIRQQCRLERDRQIDDIVAKMDGETLKHEQDFDVKIMRMKEKYENELKDLERNERNQHEKYTIIRDKLAESEANKENIMAAVKQLEIQLHHYQKMYDEHIKDKENLKETTRKELQFEVNAIKQERDIEIEKIYERVQQAIEKKDATIELLHKDNATLSERCVTLEAVVRQQRKEYFIK